MKTYRLHLADYGPKTRRLVNARWHPVRINRLLDGIQSDGCTTRTAKALGAALGAVDERGRYKQVHACVLHDALCRIAMLDHGRHARRHRDARAHADLVLRVASLEAVDWGRSRAGYVVGAGVAWLKWAAVRSWTELDYRAPKMAGGLWSAGEWISRSMGRWG